MGDTYVVFVVFLKVAVFLMDLTTCSTGFNFKTTLPSNVWDKTRSYFWDSGDDPLEYHNSYCRSSCDESQSANQGMTTWNPTCFPCSCSPHCREYGTCCSLDHPEWAQEIFSSIEQFRAEESKSVNSFREKVAEKRDLIINFALREKVAEKRDLIINRFICEENVLKGPILVVSICPPTELNSTLVDLCERNNQETMERYTPVSNIETGVTFRNIFCLMCSEDQHGDYIVVEDDDVMPKQEISDPALTVFQKWELEISCSHYQTVYCMTTLEEFYRAVLSQKSICNITLQAPPNIPYPETCDPHWYRRRETVDYTYCAHPDLKLLWLCLLLDEVAFSTSYRGQNLFCMLCDGQTPSTVTTYTTDGLTTLPPTYATAWTTRATSDTRPSAPRVPPLSLLLGYSSGRRPKLPDCSNVTYWDEIGECQPANCSAGKLAEENGECTSAIRQIRGLGYKLFLVLHPMNNTLVSEADAKNISEQIATRLYRISSGIKVNTNITIKRQAGETKGVIKKISVDAYIVGSDTQARDAYETNLLKTVLDIWSVVIYETENTVLAFRPVVMGSAYQEFHNTDLKDEVKIKRLATDPDLYLYSPSYDMYFSNNTNRQAHYHTYPTIPYAYTNTPWWSTIPSSVSLPLGTSINRHTASTHHPLSYEAYSKMESPNGTSDSDTLYIHFALEKPEREALWDMLSEFIDVTHSLTCPFVLLNISNATTHAENLTTDLDFKFKGETLSVSSTKQVSLVDGQMRLCTGLYRDLTAPILRRTTVSIYVRVRYYIEMTCVSLSVAFLLMSAITYLLFPSLRSLPGLNNLSLCISLAVAQTCVLVTAHDGADSRLSSGHCFFHAVLLHYSWLSAMAWMSVCCIHMFRVFTTHDNTFCNSRSEMKRFFHYCIYGFGLPAVIVLATVAFNSGLTSGESYGYDSNNCFMDTRRSKLTPILALALPFCTVILTNLIMFTLTVREMVQVSRLQVNSRARERRGVLTYVKLATITGVFGLMAIISELLKNDILILLTGPVMALQGVFIFVSFTFNARVGQLYLQFLRSWGILREKPKEKAAGSATTDSNRGTTTSSKVVTADTHI